MSEEKEFIDELSPHKVISSVFVFAGVIIFVLTFWSAMSSGMRIFTTMGSGFVIYTLAVIFSLKKRYVKFISPLLFIGAFLELNGYSILMDERFNNGVGNVDVADLIFISIVLLQQVCSFVALRLPVLVITSGWCAIAVVIRILNLLSVSENLGSILIGIVVLCLTYYFRKIKYPRVVEFGYLFSSIFIFVGFFNTLNDNLIFLLISSLMLYISVVIRSSQLMVTSIIATLAFIAYYTHKHYANSASWPLMLIILGVLFFAISSGAIYLKKKYMR